MCYSGTCDVYAHPQQNGLLYSQMVTHFTFFKVYIIFCSFLHFILYIKANMVSVCPSVYGDKNKTRSWNERGPQDLRGPEPRWPESSIKDLNRDSQYLVQTSRRTWNEVPNKKTRRWGPETRSSKRKPVVRVLKRRCTLLLTNTEFVFFFN